MTTDALDDALQALNDIQTDLAEKLLVAVRLRAARAAELAEALPEVAELEATPIETILAEMITAAAVRDEERAVDRAQIARLIVLIDKLGIQADENAAGMARIEGAAGHVADDLAASQARADAVDPADPAGAAADAGAKS